MVKMGQNACRFRRAHGKACRETSIRCFEAEIQSQGDLLHGEAPFADEQEKRVYTREEKLKAI